MYGSYGVPGGSAEQTFLMFLAVKPPIEAMFVEGVAALSLRDMAGDAGIVQQHAVRTVVLQLLPADAAVQRHRVAHPAGHRVPFCHRVNPFGLH